eukprot:346853-Chlamydomonas_euryale.AAC.1
MPAEQVARRRRRTHENAGACTTRDPGSPGRFPRACGARGLVPCGDARAPARARTRGRAAAPGGCPLGRVYMLPAAHHVGDVGAQRPGVGQPCAHDGVL